MVYCPIPMTVICLLILVSGQLYFLHHCIDHLLPLHTPTQGDLIHSYSLIDILNVDDTHTLLFNLDLTPELRIQKHNYLLEVSPWISYYTSDGRCQKSPSLPVL